MSGALDGTLVLDMTRTFWTSLGVALLADFGAQVVRVDGPSADEPILQSPEFQGCHDELANRNKQSVAIDIGTPGGRNVFERLMAKADVFAIDMDSTSIGRDALDYATLSRLKADLVYARGTGFGILGPDAELPALDELAAARTGMMPILPQPGQPPVYTASGQIYSSVMLAFGIVMALWHRDETGEGQEVHTSLLAGNMYGASLDVQAFLAMGGDRFLQPVSRLDAGNPMSGTLYPTQDGLWVTLTMPDTDRWWSGLAAITGLDEADERFDSHEKRCEVNRLELIAVLERAFQEHPASYWRDEFDARQLSADVIEEYSFPASDEQASRNSFVLESGGGGKTLGFPIHMSDTPASLRRDAPMPGEHTAEILGRMLGYSADEVAHLKQEGASRS